MGYVDDEFPRSDGTKTCANCREHLERGRHYDLYLDEVLCLSCTPREVPTHDSPPQPNKELELRRLCKELDEELDGVRLPASAAAIMNAIRVKLT